MAKHLEEYLADGDFDDPYHEQVFRVARQLRFRLAAERGIDWRELRVNVGIQFLEEHGVHWSAFTPGGEGNEDDGLANLVANWRRVKVGPSDIVETAYARSEEGTDVTAELTTTVGGYPRFCRFMAHLQLARGAEPVVGHQAGFAKLFGVSHRSIGTWLVNGIEDGLWRKTAEHIAPLGKAKGVAARYEVDLGKFPALDAEARRKGTPWRPS